MSDYSYVPPAPATDAEAALIEAMHSEDYTYPAFQCTAITRGELDELRALRDKVMAAHARQMEFDAFFGITTLPFDAWLSMLAGGAQ